MSHAAIDWTIAAVCFSSALGLYVWAKVSEWRSRRYEAQHLRAGHNEDTGVLTVPARRVAELPLVPVQPVPPKRLISVAEYHETLMLAARLAWTQFVNDEKWRWGQLLVKFEYDMGWDQLVAYGSELEAR